LEEWMIYRVLLSGLLLVCSFGLLVAGVLSEHILSLVYRRQRKTYFGQVLDRVCSPRLLTGAATVSLLVAIVLVWPGLMEYVSTGQTSLHWSRAIVAVFLLQGALIAGVMAILQQVVKLWRQQLDWDQRSQ